MEEIEDIIASAEEDVEDFPVDENPGEESWDIDDGKTAVKRMDRNVCLYRETVLPEKIQAFFSILDLQPGKKRKIVLWHENHRFDAFIEKTLHDPPLTRLRWNQDFGFLLQKKFPEWYDYYKKSREESGDTPPLYIAKRQEPDNYDITFEGAPLRDAPAAVELPVKPGDIIDNDTVRTIFKCSSQGAMRRSLTTNSLVLISDHTRPACEDKWIGKTFHFTGRGLTGEQGFSFNQNKALCESSEKGTGLFLFEVFNEGNQRYTGQQDNSRSEKNHQRIKSVKLRRLHKLGIQA